MPRKPVPDCCRCNDKSSCRRCSCVKAGDICTNCLPLRRGHCVNSERRLTTAITSNTTSINTATTNILPNLLVNSALSHADQTTQSASSPAFTSSDNHQHATVATTVPISANPVNSSHSWVAQPLQPPPLPPFHQMPSPSFIWGNRDSASMLKSMEDAYSEVVHWQKNTFIVPFGKAGKEFVFELSRLLRAYADGSALESIALMACTVLSVLLLQKPFHRSKQKDHLACLERRLLSWRKGDIAELLWEGRSLQSRLIKSGRRDMGKSLARSFSKLMFQGKVNAAIQLLAQHGKGRVYMLRTTSI